MDSRILHYEFVTGESVNITVSAEIAEVIYDSRRMEHASNERSRYHTAFSLDSEDYEGTNLVSEKTPDDLMEELEDREHLLDCLAHLSENQRQRILMLAQGIAAALGISRANAYILLRSDGFPTLHIGKRMVVPKDRFLQWITDSVNG